MWIHARKIEIWKREKNNEKLKKILKSACELKSSGKPFSVVIHSNINFLSMLNHFSSNHSAWFTFTICSIFIIFIFLDICTNNYEWYKSVKKKKEKKLWCSACCKKYTSKTSQISRPLAQKTGTWYNIHRHRHKQKRITYIRTHTTHTHTYTTARTLIRQCTIETKHTRKKNNFFLHPRNNGIF